MWRKPTRIGFLFYRFTRVMSGIYFVNVTQRRCGRHIVRSDDFSYRTIVTSHSLCRSSFQTRTHFVGLRVCVFYCKVRFETALSISRGIESTVRPLPCSSFPNRSRSAGLRFGIWYGPADNISFAATFFAKLTSRSFCRGSVQTRKAGLQLCCLEEQFLCL